MISIYELRLRYLFSNARNSHRGSSFDSGMYFFDSGRSALYAILKVIKSQVKDPQIYVNAYTTDVVHSTIRSLGLQMTPIDIDPMSFQPVAKDYQFDRSTVFIQTGLFGFPAFETGIYESVKNAGGFFLEDSCNSWGTMVNGNPAGSLGDASIFSFRIGKAFSTGGGAALMHRKEMKDSFKGMYSNLRNPGRVESMLKLLRSCLDYLLFEPWMLSHVSRPIRNLQKRVPLLSVLSRGGVVDTDYKVNEESMSKIGRYQKTLLERRSLSFDSELKERKAISRNLIQLLKDLPVRIPAQTDSMFASWNGLFFPILLNEGNPDELVKHLRNIGFDATRFHASVPEKSFPGLSRSEYPGTFRLVDSLVCIPNTTRMKGRERAMANAITRFFEREHESYP